MTSFGVTADDGFVVKGLDTLLVESFARARAVFGPDVDLTSTSPLRKILEVTAAEDAELWKRLEDGYYANFVSTADGATLDLLGEDLGVDRLEAAAIGQVTLTLAGGVPGRRYLVNEATALTVPGAGPVFTTAAAVTLTTTAPTADVGVRCLTRGTVGDVAATGDRSRTCVRRGVFRRPGPATITVTNAAERRRR